MKKMAIVFSVLIIIFLAVFFTIYDSNRIQKLHKEYRKVLKADSFQSEVVDLYVVKGVSFVTLKTEKIIISNSRNYDYKEIYLNDILAVGDTLVKKSGSDSLIVRKSKKEYHFIIGKFINMPH